MTNTPSTPGNGRGYEVDVVVMHTERINNSKSGNPRYRFHTVNGVYSTADDQQQNLSLAGEESGPAVLRIENARVIAWTFIKQGKD